MIFHCLSRKYSSNKVSTFECTLTGLYLLIFSNKESESVRYPTMNPTTRAQIDLILLKLKYPQNLEFR